MPSTQYPPGPGALRKTANKPSRVSGGRAGAQAILNPGPTNPFITDATVLGAAVRACRTQAGLTLEEAALTIGVAKQTLADLEAGKPTVGLGLVLKIAHELGLALFIAPSHERERVTNAIKARLQ